jgi:hypothetical protein
LKGLFSYNYTFIPEDINGSSTIKSSVFPIKWFLEQVDKYRNQVNPVLWTLKNATVLFLADGGYLTDW